MKILENKKYREDVQGVAELPLPWDRLHGKSVLISGGSGLIGSFLVDVLMHKNLSDDLACKVFVIGRNLNRTKERFLHYWDSECFSFITHDINQPLSMTDAVDFVFHLASNTHPLLYATDPIATITTNVIGLKNMLDFAVNQKAERFVYASSNEIYGENRGDTELFSEDYCGYIDSNTLRAGYPESKRCGEALCQAYIQEKKIDIVIPRFTRSYGPTMLLSDTKAISQFIQKAIAGEDIVLKSAGNQYYSFTYVADAISGLLTVLFFGECGEAYNIADVRSDIRLKDLAELIAHKCGKQVVFELPDEVEASGYSKATKARLDSTKLQALGWSASYEMEKGIDRTIDILRDLSE